MQHFSSATRRTFQPPFTVSVAWTKISGPGTVTFANSNTLATTASFSAPGDYRLRLIANDGQASTISDLLVTAIIRPILFVQPLPGALEFSWQPSGGNWELQYQTNLSGANNDTAWKIVGVLTNNPYLIPSSFGNDTLFYRLQFISETP